MSTENEAKVYPVISNKIYLKDVDFYMYGVWPIVEPDGKQWPSLRCFKVSKMWYCDNPEVVHVFVSANCYSKGKVSHFVSIVFKHCRFKSFKSEDSIDNALEMAEAYLNDGGIGDDCDYLKIDKMLSDYVVCPYLYNYVGEL